MHIIKHTPKKVFLKDTIKKQRIFLLTFLLSILLANIQLRFDISDSDINSYFKNLGFNFGSPSLVGGLYCNYFYLVLC